MQIFYILKKYIIIYILFTLTLIIYEKLILYTLYIQILHYSKFYIILVHLFILWIRLT